MRTLLANCWSTVTRVTGRIHARRTPRVPNWLTFCPSTTHLAGELLGLHQEVPQVVLEGGEVLVLEHARHAGGDLQQSIRRCQTASDDDHSRRQPAALMAQHMAVETGRQ